MTDEPSPDKVVDARGLSCPGPLMELVKALRSVKPGQVVLLYSDDETSRVDIPRWVEKAGHELLKIVEREGHIEFLVRKSAAAKHV